MISKTPLPGYGLATIESSQLENVEYGGEDKFDTPQTGKLIKLREEDSNKQIREKSDLTWGELLGKRIYWKKYADADGTFEDTELGTVIYIQLDKIMGYDNE